MDGYFYARGTSDNKVSLPSDAAFDRLMAACSHQPKSCFCIPGRDADLPGDTLLTVLAAVRRDPFLGSSMR